MSEKNEANLPVATVGWREWIQLPDLNIPAIKAKMDTGARSSSLHTHFIEPIDVDGKNRVRFGVRPIRKRSDLEIVCEADILDYRRVKDSGGHSEMRCFICTTVILGNRRWPVEVSLTNREGMRFHMLLGRTALAKGFIVDPARSYLTGRRLAKHYKN